MKNVLMLALSILMLFSSWTTADTLLLNGDFENTEVIALPDGRTRFEGWTIKPTNGGSNGFFLEGQNGISAFSTVNTKFDGATSNAEDPFSPFIDNATPNLDNFIFLRPSGPAPTSSFSEAFSDIFLKDGNITMDVWRESSASFSQVRFHDAQTDAVLDSFTLTGGTALQAWDRVTLDVSGIADGTDLYVVLKGGTNQAGSGFLTLFDNIFGGATQEFSIPELAGGSDPETQELIGAVPEPSSFFLSLICLGFACFYRKKH